ncbi:conserved hypothetical protein [Methanothermobacter sp. MT-2]|nr:conserved hypothetical protein [Methanothermobacter sp. MT-2]
MSRNGVLPKSIRSKIPIKSSGKAIGRSSIVLATDIPLNESSESVYPIIIEEGTTSSVATDAVIMESLNE